jgi:hypothetical protein
VTDVTANWVNPVWADHVRKTKPYSQALDRILHIGTNDEAQLARKRRNAKAGRARRKRGQYRRMLTIPGAQLRRLAELGYLERVADPVGPGIARPRRCRCSRHGHDGLLRGRRSDS